MNRFYDKNLEICKNHIKRRSNHMTKNCKNKEKQKTEQLEN